MKGWLIILLVGVILLSGCIQSTVSNGELTRLKDENNGLKFQLQLKEDEIRRLNSSLIGSQNQCEALLGTGKQLWYNCKSGDVGTSLRHGINDFGATPANFEEGKRCNSITNNEESNRCFFALALKSRQPQFCYNAGNITIIEDCLDKVMGSKANLYYFIGGVYDGKCK